MAKARNELTRLEWVLMDALWEVGQATATDIQKHLEKSQGWAYSTVKTMLDRLVQMGFVKARRVGNVYEYSPKVQRPTAVRRVIDEVIDRFCEGSVAPFVQQLLERGDLDKSEIAEIKGILEKHSEKQRGRQ